jgi:hypothetical protein
VFSGDAHVSDKKSSEFQKKRKNSPGSENIEKFAIFFKI